MTKAVALILVLLCSIAPALAPAEHAGESPHVIVDAGAPAGKISPLLFGHNLQWWDNATYMWDPVKRRTRSEVLLILQEASRMPATLRFPGGGWGDLLHWRRGIGSPEKRPKQLFYGSEKEQTFGTDEFIIFTREISPVTAPLMIVNWWDWNRAERLRKGNPEYIEDAPTKGMWEAANWVEYCNGVVTPELLDRAVKEKWEPSHFVDSKDPSRESRETNAEEWADGVRSWRSYEQAPKGYFAWLRRYFAWERASGPIENGIETWRDLEKFKEESYGGPYGIRYWEIGNEIYFRDPNSYDRYRETLIEWSEAIKRANDVDGRIISGEYTVEEGDAEGRAELGAYGGKELRVGACMIGTQEKLSEWDRKVLTEDTARYIEWLAVHPYASVYPDRRYAGVLWVEGDQTGPREPMRLEAGVTYTFRVRAMGTPISPGTDPDKHYPRMKVELAPEAGGPPIPLATKDKRVINGTSEVYVRFPLDADKERRKFTDYENDYIYTVAVPTTGKYYLRITATKHFKASDDHTIIWISLVTRMREGDADESLIEFIPEEDQIKAYYSMPARLRIRLALLEAHATRVSPKKALGLGCTEYRAMFGWSGIDSNHSMKGTIIAADMIKEFIEGRVVLANYWSHYGEIAEIRHLGYSPVRDMYLDIRGKWAGMPQPDGFLRTGPQQLFKLLGEHFGSEMLATRTPRTGEEEEHYHLTRQFGDVRPILEPDKVPYLSAIAGGSDRTGGNFRKVFLLVINKYWKKDRRWIVRFDRLGSRPREIKYHTLKCWDAGASALTAINTFTSPDRISVRTETRPASDFDADTSTFEHTFPASSITVVELTME